MAENKLADRHARVGFYPCPQRAEEVLMKDGRRGVVATTTGFWSQANAYEVAVLFEGGTAVERVNVQRTKRDKLTSKGSSYQWQEV